MISPAVRQQGFTLTEVLVALFIFSVVVAGALQVFNFIQSASDANDRQIQRLREVQLAVRQIEDDIRHLVLRERRDEYGDGAPLLRGESSSVNSYLEFTRAGWRNPAKLARSELQHLKYEFVDDQLLRHHWLYVDPAQENQQLTRTLLNGVNEFKLEFLEEERWKEDWLVERGSKGSLPRAIRVTLRLEDYGEIYRLFPLPSFEQGQQDAAAEGNREQGDANSATELGGRR